MPAGARGDLRSSFDALEIQAVSPPAHLTPPEPIYATLHNPLSNMAQGAAGQAKGSRRSTRRGASLRLGRRLSSTQEIRLVQAGVPVALARQIQQEVGLTQEGLSKVLGIPRRTLIEHMKKKHFNADESDRVIRFKRILEQAMATFDGDKQAALSWLNAPNRALDGSPPMDLVSMGSGARAVEQLLGRMEHSLYS